MERQLPPPPHDILTSLTQPPLKLVLITYLPGTRSCIHVNNMVLIPPSHQNYSPPTMSSSTSISSLCFRSPPSTTTVLPLYNSKNYKHPHTHHQPRQKKIQQSRCTMNHPPLELQPKARGSVRPCSSYSLLLWTKQLSNNHS